jgi:hypothetical protein
MKTKRNTTENEFLDDTTTLSTIPYIPHPVPRKFHHIILKLENPSSTLLCFLWDYTLRT